MGYNLEKMLMLADVYRVGVGKRFMPIGHREIKHLQPHRRRLQKKQASSVNPIYQSHMFWS